MTLPIYHYPLLPGQNVHLRARPSTLNLHPPPPPSTSTLHLHLHPAPPPSIYTLHLQAQHTFSTSTLHLNPRSTLSTSTSTSTPPPLHNIFTLTIYPHHPLPTYTSSLHHLLQGMWKLHLQVSPAKPPWSEAQAVVAPWVEEPGVRRVCSGENFLRSEETHSFTSHW